MKFPLLLFLIFAYYAIVVIVGLWGIEAREARKITTAQQVSSVFCAVIIPPFLIALIVGSI